MFIEAKENMLVMSVNIGNISRGIANLKENSIEILDLKIEVRSSKFYVQILIKSLTDSETMHT